MAPRPNKKIAVEVWRIGWRLLVLAGRKTRKVVFTPYAPPVLTPAAATRRKSLIKYAISVVIMEFSRADGSTFKT